MNNQEFRKTAAFGFRAAAIGLLAYSCLGVAAEGFNEVADRTDLERGDVLRAPLVISCYNGIMNGWEVGDTDSLPVIGHVGNIFNFVGMLPISSRDKIMPAKGSMAACVGHVYGAPVMAHS